MFKVKNRRAAVVATIGFLAVFGGLCLAVSPRLVSHSICTKSGAAKTDISTIGAALDMFQVDIGRFPTTAEGLTALIEKPAWLAKWNGPYIKGKMGWPVDPWNNSYRYQWPSKHNANYDLWSCGLDGQNGTEDDIVSWDNP